MDLVAATRRDGRVRGHGRRRGTHLRPRRGGLVRVTATLAVALASTEAARRGHVITALRRRLAEQDAVLRGRLAEQETQTLRLAKELLPVAISRLQHGSLTDDVMKAVVLSPTLDPRSPTPTGCCCVRCWRPCATRRTCATPPSAPS
ncbi:hypothetical protein NKH77_07070 [Streptomyces sp. M19]